MKPGNAGGAKAPCSDANVQSGKSPGIGASLPTPLDSVRTLQSTLQAKAKSEAAARFNSLWDKVCREDVLLEAYRRCRANCGAPGFDDESFKDTRANGVAAKTEAGTEHPAVPVRASAAGMDSQGQWWATSAGHSDDP